MQRHVLDKTEKVGQKYPYNTNVLDRKFSATSMFRAENIPLFKSVYERLVCLIKSLHG